jgi:hypothetical protein
VENLVLIGPTAVPAIREFLNKRLDHYFGPEDIQQVGFPSIRTALIDALRQIGGSSAIGASYQILKLTADPRELALLARNLESMAPGLYRKHAVLAAQETLDLAAAGRLVKRDVAPLFEILQTYGDANVVANLVQAAPRWKYYATAALAHLPEGAGIPSLVAMVQNPGGTQDAALQMLAQIATQSENAHDTLLQLAGSNRIPANLWPYLISPLSGDEIVFQASILGDTEAPLRNADLKTTHINYGNQNFYRTPGPASLTPDNLNRKMAFIDELLEATSDPAAVQTLNNSRERVLQRLAKVSGSEKEPGQ